MDLKEAIKFKKKVNANKILLVNMGQFSRAEDLILEAAERFQRMRVSIDSKALAELEPGRTRTWVIRAGIIVPDVTPLPWFPDDAHYATFEEAFDALYQVKP